MTREDEQPIYPNPVYSQQPSYPAQPSPYTVQPSPFPAQGYPNPSPYQQQAYYPPAPYPQEYQQQHHHHNTPADTQSAYALITILITLAGCFFVPFCCVGCTMGAIGLSDKKQSPSSQALLRVSFALGGCCTFFYCFLWAFILVMYAVSAAAYY